MYKNLNAESLGISGRHNELIELSLTYKYRGFDLEIQELMRQIEARGEEHAMRFLKSANVEIGSFELPVDLAASDEEFQNQLSQLENAAQLAESLGTTRCIATLLPYCVDRAYHENFELYRDRIGQVVKVLEPHKIRLGLGFVAPKNLREQGDSQFIATPDALLTLIQTVGEDVGLCLDTWHWHVSGGTIDQLKDFPAEKIVMVRVADAPSDVELDEMTDEQRMPAGSTRVVPNVDWLRWLIAQEYDGPITPFCHSSQFSGGARNRSVEQLGSALTKLIDEAGGAETADGAEAAVDEEQAATAG